MKRTTLGEVIEAIVDLRDFVAANFGEMKGTQASHSATLAEHSQTLAEHSQTLADHSAALNRIERRLDRHGVRLEALEGKTG